MELQHNIKEEAPTSKGRMANTTSTVQLMITLRLCSRSGAIAEIWSIGSVTNFLILNR